MRLEGVGERLQGKVRICSDGAGPERVVQVANEISQGSVDSPLTGTLRFDGLFQALVEEFDLVRGERRQQNSLGGIPAIQRWPGHTGLFGDDRQGQLDRTPRGN